MAAIFAADTWCEDCADSIRSRIAAELWDMPVPRTMPDWSDDTDFQDLDELRDYLDSMDERTYDSDDYPKYCSEDDESDSPMHCGDIFNCLNPIEFSDGSNCAYFFGNDLTSDGEEYVKNAVNEGRISGTDNKVTELWADCYSYLDYYEQCANCGDYADLDDDDLCTECNEREG